MARGVPFCVVVLVVLTLVLGPGGALALLPHTSQTAIRFLTAYIANRDFSRVNIFVPANAAAAGAADDDDDDEGVIVPVEMLLRLSSSVKPCSVGLHRLNNSSQVLETTRITATASRVLSVIFLHTSHHLRIFYDVCEAGGVVEQYPWLVFGDHSLIVSLSSLKPRLPLDNLVMFATLAATTAPNSTNNNTNNNNTTNNNTSSISNINEVNVYEMYSVTPDSSTYTLKRLGTWRGEASVSLPREDWSERRTNLTGLHLRCTTMAQAPFIYLSEPGPDLSVEVTGGYAKDVWDMLQEIHGFTYECQVPGDGSFGTLVDGKWSGLVGDLVEGRADVAMTSLDHNTARASVVSFTAGLREVGYRLVARRPGLMDQTWTSFTSELMPDAWLGTLAFVVMAPPCLVFCARYSPFETQSVTLKDAYILAIGAFAIQGSWLEVRSVSTRIVFLTIFVTTLVVYAHYTSALVSLLTVTSTSNGFNSLQELLNDRSYNFGFQAGTFLEEEFKTAQHSVFSDVWEELVLSDANNLVESPQDGITKVANERYVYMIEENEFRSLFGDMCQVQLLKTSYFNTHTGFALTSNSPLKKMFDNQLIRMRDGGILSRAWQSWQPPPALCTAPRMVAINFQHIITAFLLLLLGVALAAVLIPCERLHWNVVGRRKVLRSQMKQDTTLQSSSLTVGHGTSTSSPFLYPPLVSSTSLFHTQY
ncbi:hypothetical protein Pmani_012074 [Petrolisthes manimaculis]|uniref:Uncharacterized protein n=1 Tax=Petrolisthes manimaculis TaxID=1843537 RepID=A0AAE1UF16_9EUCA|nr:hypothetical protein Pmani_012074 [Petrolisthes manimaculis]